MTKYPKNLRTFFPVLSPFGLNQPELSLHARHLVLYCTHFLFVSLFVPHIVFLPAATADRSRRASSCCWGGGNVFVRPLDDLVAKSCTNNLGRYYNFKKPDLQKFLRVTNLFRENHPKRFKLQI